MEYGIFLITEQFSHSLLKEAGAFSVNFLMFEHLHMVRSLRRSSGSEIDKAKEFNISYKVGEKQEPPLWM